VTFKIKLFLYTRIFNLVGYKMLQYIRSNKKGLSYKIIDLPSRPILECHYWCRFKTNIYISYNTNTNTNYKFKQPDLKDQDDLCLSNSVTYEMLKHTKFNENICHKNQNAR